MEQVRLEDCRMRYIVPFSYEKEKYSLDSIEALMLDKDSNANYCWKVDDIRKGEQDLYDYFLKAFEGTTDGSLGWAFSLERKEGDFQKNVGYNVDNSTAKGGKKVLLNLIYVDKKTDKKYLFNVVEAGLYMFHTGIGLFWYEIGFKPETMPKEELIRFQNNFKELNRNKADSYIKIVGQENPTLKTEETKVDGIEYVIARHYPVNGEINYVGYPVFDMTMGKWIFDILKSIPGNLHFYEERQCVLDETIIVPDKPLLFNYFSIDKTQLKDGDLEVVDLAYYLTNGYKRSYIMSKDEKNNMFKPFDNMYWYVSYEGIGCYAYYDNSNRDFFVGTLYNKIINDYFLIYIQILQQKHSAIRLSECIEQNLPADVEEYNNKEKYKETAETIQKLLLEVNVFLTKNVWASISHVHHQNLLYEYAHKQLRIENDVNSLTEGLGALEKIQRAKDENARLEKEKAEEKRDKRLMDYFAMFAIVSVFADGFTFLYTFLVDKIIGINNIPKMYIEIINAVLVTALVMVCGILPINMIKPMFDERKNHGKKSIDLICWTIFIALVMVICITTAWFFTVK